MLFRLDLVLKDSDMDASPARDACFPIRASLTARRTRLAAAAALSLLLAACGGGSAGPSSGDASGSQHISGSDGSSMAGTGAAENPDVTNPPAAGQRTFSGVVRNADATVPAATVVCADRNADLVCGSDEEQVVVDAQGAYSLQVAVADISATPTWPLVAVVPVTAGDAVAVTSTQTSYSLAARADQAVIDAVSTLAWAGAADLGLVSGLDPHSATDTRAQRVRSLLHPALVQTVSTLRDLSPEAAVAPLTRTAARSLAKVAPGYVDPGTRLYLRTATPRTLRAEAVHDALGAGQTCSHAPIPSLNIVTEGGATIDSKETYVKATLSVSGAGFAPASYEKASIRGRGNSTWELDKKPYRLKLDKAAALLGLPAHKNWALLANHIDKSLLRNDLSFCMGRLLGFDFTPASRHVELTLNGDYVGVYQLTDHIEADRYRVNIDEDKNETDPAALAFMLEIDWRMDEEYNFYSAMDGVSYMVKSDISPAQAPMIKTFVDDMEAALYGSNPLDSAVGYGHWMDASTLIDLYLVNELSRNGDAFTSSAKLWRPRHGLLGFGPLWDFDVAYGNGTYINSTFSLNPALDSQVDARTSGWWARQFGYVRRLIDVDPDFRRHVAARWAFLHKRMGELQAFITDGATNLDGAQQRNFARWPILDQSVAVNDTPRFTYAAEVEYLRTWLTGRDAWLDAAIKAEFGSRAGS